MINDICPLANKNKAIIGFLLILLNLQSPAMEGNFCKEDKLEGSSIKAHSMLYSAISVDDDLHIEAQKSISSQLYASVLQFLQYILQLDKARMTTEKRQIVSFCEQHVFAYKRLEDILNVSEKIASVPNWYQVFESAGLSLIASGDVLQGGLHKAGVYYQFKKKDDR